MEEQHRCLAALALNLAMSGVPYSQIFGSNTAQGTNGSGIAQPRARRNRMNAQDDGGDSGDTHEDGRSSAVKRPKRGVARADRKKARSGEPSNTGASTVAATSCDLAQGLMTNGDGTTLPEILKPRASARRGMIRRKPEGQLLDSGWSA